MAIIKPKCDRCQGIEFEIKSTDPEPPTTYALASEYFKGIGLPQIVDCVLRYRYYRATCQKCGAHYDYSLPC